MPGNPRANCAKVKGLLVRLSFGGGIGATFVSIELRLEKGEIFSSVGDIDEVLEMLVVES